MLSRRHLFGLFAVAVAAPLAPRPALSLRRGANCVDLGTERGSATQTTSGSRTFAIGKSDPMPLYWSNYPTTSWGRVHDL
jgi:hypothetical protein